MGKVTYEKAKLRDRAEVFKACSKELLGSMEVTQAEMRMRGGLPGRSQAHTYFMQSRSTFNSFKYKMLLEESFSLLKSV